MAQAARNQVMEEAQLLQAAQDRAWNRDMREREFGVDAPYKQALTQQVQNAPAEREKDRQFDMQMQAIKNQYEMGQISAQQAGSLRNQLILMQEEEKNQPRFQFQDGYAFDPVTGKATAIPGYVAPQRANQNPVTSKEAESAMAQAFVQAGLVKVKDLAGKEVPLASLYGNQAYDPATILSNITPEQQDVFNQGVSRLSGVPDAQKPQEYQKIIDDLRKMGKQTPFDRLTPDEKAAILKSGRKAEDYNAFVSSRVPQSK